MSCTVYMGRKPKGTLTYYECGTCHKQFKHLECDTCDDQFSLVGNLKAHKRIYSGLKPYGCETCHKQFTLKGNLKAHNIFTTVLNLLNVEDVTQET